MNRRFLTVVLTVLILCITLIPVSADNAMNKLVDEAGLLSESEAEQISSELDKLNEKYKYDIFIITLASFEGDEPAEKAEVYREYIEFEYDDVVFLMISMEEGNREIYIFPYGQAKTAFTNDGQDYILDKVAGYLSDGEYADGFKEFTVLCDDFIAKANEGTPYTSSSLPKEPFNVFTSLIVSVAIGFVISFIVVSSMKSKLKSVQRKAAANDYLKQGSLMVYNQRDYFLYRTVNRVKKANSSSSGGGHTTSSSGGSTGRGRSF